MIADYREVERDVVYLDRIVVNELICPEVHFLAVLVIRKEFAGGGELVRVPEGGCLRASLCDGAYIVR